ncbi:L-lactate MFS transporter [Clostridium massiliamazoniense]|uniref:L-lactate MFS transporter n=1 Tax=Clostridium massiliamazoniense TaxID=1347366 RepID=UPI0006D7ABA7|nr:OFA family MFS transporter [Clostridium massiliamazoniense]
MEKKTNRILILIGTMLAQLGLGTLYTWSLFNAPLSHLHGWSLEQVVLSFSITSFCLAIGTLFAGKLQETFGIRIVVAACAIILGLGLAFAPKFDNLIELYISAGVIVGLVNGIAYILTLSNCLKWFPDHKGVISSVSIGCYGLGSLIFKYINADLIKNTGIVHAFMYWGLMAFILVFIGALFLKDAPKTVSSSVSSVVKEFNWPELFKEPSAYLLFIAFFSSCLSGLYLIGTAKNIGILFAHLSPAMAGSAVALVAIFNTLGRLILGSLSDRLPRTKVSAFAFLLMFIGIIILLFVPLSMTTFTVSIALIAFAFGGNLTIFPAIVSEYFGLTNHSKNYGVIYQGFGIGGLLGGVVANVMGGFKPTFWLMLLVAILSILIMVFIKPPKVNRVKA